ncbi:uncharacterized protein PFL1_00930 [Pseudozyma flocculosa PF-1]|nr:uncharacterized protein PFL1_00930 [Pseudozyma flocculosa PF-1]EPQ31597.1 hypothetical protein PFL1_00930 [Pseudozyma flocculosa PF-1]
MSSLPASPASTIPSAERGGQGMARDPWVDTCEWKWSPGLALPAQFSLLAVVALSTLHARVYNHLQQGHCRQRSTPSGSRRSGESTKSRSHPRTSPGPQFFHRFARTILGAHHGPCIPAVFEQLNSQLPSASRLEPPLTGFPSSPPPSRHRHAGTDCNHELWASRLSDRLRIACLPRQRFVARCVPRGLCGSSHDAPCREGDDWTMSSHGWDAAGQANALKLSPMSKAALLATSIESGQVSNRTAVDAGSSEMVCPAILVARFDRKGAAALPLVENPGLGSGIPSPPGRRLSTLGSLSRARPRRAVDLFLDRSSRDRHEIHIHHIPSLTTSALHLNNDVLCNWHPYLGHELGRHSSRPEPRLPHHGVRSRRAHHRSLCRTWPRRATVPPRGLDRPIVGQRRSDEDQSEGDQSNDVQSDDSRTVQETSRAGSTSPDPSDADEHTSGARLWGTLPPPRFSGANTASARADLWAVMPHIFGTSTPATPARLWQPRPPRPLPPPRFNTTGTATAQGTEAMRLWLRASQE